MASQISRVSARTCIIPTSSTVSRFHSAAQHSASENRGIIIRSSQLSCCGPTRNLTTLKPNFIGPQSAAEVSRVSFSQTAKMSSMPASYGHNEPCCNIPPIISNEYVAKGLYEELGSYKTYVTGPADAEKGIIAIYDIFGYFDQTLQGSDILASSNKNQKYKIFIPDWFKGKPCPIEWMPPDTEEKQKNLGGFFSDPEHAPQTIASKLPRYLKSVQARNPLIKSWAILGYCWGGKVASLMASDESSIFEIAAVCHPAMLDPAEADGVKIPFILLASGEGPAEQVAEFGNRLKVPHYVETFGDQVHGWMAARGDLTNPRIKEEYARGYQTVLDFFSKNWV